MRKFNVFRFATLIGVLPVATALHGYPFGPGPGYSGAPGDTTCAACHGGGQTNTGGGNIAVNVLNYTPATPQHVVVTISDPAARRWGFEASPRLASDNSSGGSLTSTDANTQVVANGPLQYVEHTLTGTRAGTTGAITFEFDWTPPAAGAGEVILYIAANAANGNGQADAGDHIYAASFRLAPAPAEQTLGPVLAAGTAVVNGASFQPGISPGAWISILGTNLAPGTRTWRADEIVNGKLPASLDGVAVSINGKPAAVYFISPTQLNVQVPDDNAVGNVEVKVTTPQGTATTTAAMQPVAPGFFMFDPAGRKYIAALHSDFTFLGPAGLFSPPPSTPAKPGEVILLYATGCGANPATPAGQVVTAPAPIDPATVIVRIGNLPARVTFAGITGAGLFQVNVTVPDTLADGDAPVTIEMAGARSQDNAFIAVQKVP